jgi:hypothetical protein
MGVRLLSIRYGLSREVIETLAADKHWGVHGSLRDQIDQSAMKATIDRAVSKAFGQVPEQDGSQLIDEQRQIDQYGQLVAGVIEEQRKDIKRGREFAGKLLERLEALEPPEVDDNAIESMAAAVADTHPDVAEQLRTKVGVKTQDDEAKFLGRQIAMLGQLAGTQETYIGLEREAWGMGKSTDPNAQPGAGNVDALVDAALTQIGGAR